MREASRSAALLRSLGEIRNEAAMRIHDEWAGEFKRLRNGQRT